MLRWKSSLKPAAAAPATDYRSTIIADSPVAYWRLGESSGTTTASDEIGSSDGSYGNDVTLGVTGALSGDSNTSISLAGSSTQYDGVTVSSLATASYSSGITIEFWANWDSTNYSGFGIEAYKDSNNRIFLDARGSSPHWDFRIAGTWYSAVGAGFQDGWHLYAFTHDGTNAKTYRDGVLQNTQSASATTFDPTSMGIGQGSAGYNVFTGGVDEAAIYNSALSATELLAHYTAGTGSGGAITLEDSAENEGFTGYSSPYDFSVSYPAVSTNDIMLAILTTERRVDFDGTPPAGWTKVIETDGDNSFNPTQAVYWYRATGSASASTGNTWSSIVNGAQQYYAWVGAYSGCVTSGSPIDASAGSFIPYSTNWSQSITTQSNNAMILAVAGSDNNARTFVWSDGTELVDKIYQSTASVTINEKIESTAGATTRSGTISAGQSGTMTAVALRDTAPTPLQTRTVTFDATDASTFTIDSDSGQEIWTDDKLNQASVGNGLRFWNGSEAGNSGATYNSGTNRWSFSSASDSVTWWESYWVRVKQDPGTGTYSDWIYLTDANGDIEVSAQAGYNNIGSTVTNYSGPGTWTTHAAGFRYQVEIYSDSNRP